MAHLFQEYLDENAHNLGSGLYKELSDRIMNLNKEMQLSAEEMQLNASARMVSAIPSTIHSAPVLQLTKPKGMYRKFANKLVNHKIQEIQKLPNIQLRSAMISAWKDDMVAALLDEHTMNKLKAKAHLSPL